MITDAKRWHYLAVKSLSALLRGVKSNHNGDFYCLNCFHSYSTKNKVRKLEKLCTNHDYCYVKMPNKYNKILKCNHGEKSLKALFMIYADLECLPEKMHSCQNNLERKSLTQRTKLSIRLLAINCLQIVYLMQQKISLIITEAKIVWKGFIKT